MFTPITVGVVGPSRKLASTPMRAIVSALRHADPNLNVIQLDDAFMLNTPIALWPSLHVLVALYAPPFPLEKVLAYVKLRRPVLVNNLYMQPYMMDRRCIRAVLRREGVPTPNAVFVDRANGDVVTQSSGGNVLRVQTSRGVSHTMEKPFVEKPVDPEDHNVYIYYKGGGVRKLFRKTKHESSRYDPNQTAVRANGSYIYEKFYEPEKCADVKVYAVGDYFYAEARKAPHIDGIVDRDSRGLERRVPVVLSDAELAICRKATKAFDQFVLGFDLLRGPGDTRFVIDVNGWSLVKNSDEYAVQCGNLLARHIDAVMNKRHHTSADLDEQAENRASTLAATAFQGSQQSCNDIFDNSHSPCVA